MRRLWPVALLGFLCVVFYWDVLWLPPDHVVADRDLTDMFLHWLRFARSSIQKGVLPLWNPHLFSGVPFAANPQPALFYPFTWLAFLLPVSKAFGWIVVLHFWIAGVGTFAWLRSERASILGALVGSVAFAFSGTFFVRVSAGHLGVITTQAWLPLMLWAYGTAVDRRSWRWVLVGGGLTGLSILAGHSASFVLVALALGLYGLFKAWVRWREEERPRAAVLPLVKLGVVLLVGVGLAAVQLLPTLQYVALSSRQAGAGIDFATRFSWPPGYLITLLVPNFFGEPAQTGYWGGEIYDEVIFYVGVLPLLLALLAIRLRRRRPLFPFLLLLGLGALLLAFGQYGILHTLFYRFVPLFRSMRAPARAGFLFTLSAAASAGLAISALERTTVEERRRILGPLTGSRILLAAGATLVLMVLGFGAFALGREVNEGAGRLYHQANQMGLFLIFFLLGAGLLLAWKDGTLSPAQRWLAVALVVVDLWTFGVGAVNPTEIEESAYWRIVAGAVDEPEAARVLPWELKYFEQNGAMAFDLRSTLGYDPLELRRYQEFVGSRRDPQARTYDLLNARYLATTTTQEFEETPDAPHLIHEEAGVLIYERPTALPRAWVASQVDVVETADVLPRIHDPEFDPTTTALVELGDAERLGDCEAVGEPSTVTVEQAGINRLEMRVEGGGGLLVVSEVAYPGWRATIDEEPVPVVRTDYVLRGVCVPPGAHRVEMTFDPPLLKIGAAVTLVTVLVSVLAAVRLGRKRKRRP